MYVGALRANNVSAKMQEVEELLANATLLDVNHPVVEKYANVKKRLLDKGRPIPENDIWIAAFALQHELPLYTHDKHFRNVDGLQLFNPLSSI